MSDPNQPQPGPHQQPSAFSQPGSPPPHGTTPGPPAQQLPFASMGSGYPGPYAGPPPDSDSRTMAMLAHLLGIFLSFLGPLIIWLLKKEEKPFVDHQGKEALNFQLTVLIGWVAMIIVSCITLGIGALLMFPLGVVVIVFCIIAAVEANKGNAYRYPVNIRMIK